MKEQAICNFRPLPKLNWIVLKFFLLIFLLPKIPSASFAAAPEREFRLHLLSEPASLDPTAQINSNSGYLLQQLSAPLLSLRKGSLHPAAGACHFVDKKFLQVRCRILAGKKWSDGRPLSAEDYVFALKKWLDPQQKKTLADMFFSIKNAQSFSEGKVPFSQVGIRASKPNQLDFDLQQRDPEFLFTLAHPLFTALRPEQSFDAQSVWPGPYTIESWTPRRHYLLKPNSHWHDHELRPKIRFRFVQEDSVALQMYRKKELDYLRRLPTLNIAEFKSSKDYHEVTQFRADYYGMLDTETLTPSLREALGTHLDFRDLQKLFQAQHRPGCFYLPFAQNGPECLPFKQNAQADFSQTPPLTFTFSKQAGEDQQRAFEWLQSEAKKRLRLRLTLSSLETKEFFQQLDAGNLVFFRRGLSPDRPTCLSVLESFLPNSSGNHLGLKLKGLPELLTKIKRSLSISEKKSLCNLGLKMILSTHQVIPAGSIYFSVLARPEWQGWQLNEMNHLDLSGLRFLGPQ
jgi:oligopeptide transport system substrate-binding protein